MFNIQVDKIGRVDSAKGLSEAIRKADFLAVKLDKPVNVFAWGTAKPTYTAKPKGKTKP